MKDLDKRNARNLVVLAQPKREGFNRAVANAAAAAFADGETTIIDLYAEGFDPVMPAEELPRKFSFDEKTLRYQEAVRAAERLVFVHPDWWGGPPAIMKGFLDRVFRPGVAYGFHEADFRDADAPGLFAGKRADIFMTTDALAPESENGSLGWPPAAVWKENVMEFCGIGDARVHVFWNLRGSTYAERKAWLDGAARLLVERATERVPAAAV
jgi:NAD(P)H dehydrogenase (quinone)